MRSVNQTAMCLVCFACPHVVLLIIKMWTDFVVVLLQCVCSSSAFPRSHQRFVGCLTCSGGLQTQLPGGYCWDASPDSELWSEQTSWCVYSATWKKGRAVKGSILKVLREYHGVAYYLCISWRERHIASRLCVLFDFLVHTVDVLTDITILRLRWGK